MKLKINFNNPITGKLKNIFREEIISKNRSSEITEQVKIRFWDNPQILIYNSVSYNLRGFISY